jgi:peptidyl-prolyl cis-trans isomerase C
MKYCLFLLGAAAWAQPPAAPPATLSAPPPAPDAIVLTIGTEKITRVQFEQILASLPDQQRAMAQTPAGRKRIAEQLSDMKVLAQEARQSNIDQNPRIQTQIALQGEQILANAEYQALANTGKIDDAAMHAYYDAHKNEWEQLKARHILIAFKGSPVKPRPGQKELTEEEALAKAKDLRAKILAGAKFEELAKTESDDTGAAQQGGDLGSFGKGRMVPEFEKAAFAAEPGKVTEPVKSQFGYHLILVEAHSTKSFDEAKPEIEQKMKNEVQQKAAQQGLEALKKKTTVVYNESYFGK